MFKLIPLKPITPLLLVALLLSCFVIAQTAQAVSPPPDGGYPGFNTAEGQNALQDLTSGAANTAVGAYALFSTTTASYDTAVGAGALLLNITGLYNTAIGSLALFSNVDGSSNEAMGDHTLSANTDGIGNVAIGDTALGGNVHGWLNTAVGYFAGATVEGDYNIYIGASSADGVTSESGTIRIGEPGFVSACFIAGINGASVMGGTAVFVDANGKLGTVPAGSPLSANELLKQHRMVQELKATIALQDGEIKVLATRLKQQSEAIIAKVEATDRQQQKQIEALTATLQKVSAQLEVSRTAPQTVLNDQ
jgi:hypothetical protein